jgi:hypothetical protein
MKRTVNMIAKPEAPDSPEVLAFIDDIAHLFADLYLAGLLPPMPESSSGGQIEYAAEHGEDRKTHQ